MQGIVRIRCCECCIGICQIKRVIGIQLSGIQHCDPAFLDLPEVGCVQHPFLLQISFRGIAVTDLKRNIHISAACLFSQGIDKSLRHRSTLTAEKSVWICDRAERIVLRVKCEIIGFGRSIQNTVHCRIVSRLFFLSRFLISPVFVTAFISLFRRRCDAVQDLDIMRGGVDLQLDLIFFQLVFLIHIFKLRLVEDDKRLSLFDVLSLLDKDLTHSNAGYTIYVLRCSFRGNSLCLAICIRVLAHVRGEFRDLYHLRRSDRPCAKELHDKERCDCADSYESGYKIFIMQESFLFHT